ncbi:MAG: hypothetical protein HC831_20850 [Chloroflexia bacterium]|nr:hypothetical protein [Chloroflexia bacterium]
MILIAHRGNINGPRPKWENDKSYVIDAVNAGYKCEIDVWYLNNNFYLSHDYPKHHHLIDLDFLIRPVFYIHCKNIPALQKLIKFNTFFIVMTM